MGGSVTNRMAEVPHQRACHWTWRRKAAMYSKHFHPTTNKDQAHEIQIPPGWERSVFIFPPDHSVWSTQQYGQTVSMNRFEQNMKSDWCWKHTHAGSHKGMTKKRGGPMRQGLLKNSNPHELLRKLLFSLGRFLMLIAEGYFNTIKNSMSSGKEVQ